MNLMVKTVMKIQRVMKHNSDMTLKFRCYISIHEDMGFHASEPIGTTAVIHTAVVILSWLTVTDM